MNENISLSRLMLREVLALVKAAFPECDEKKARIYCCDRRLGKYEFRYGDFYDCVRADNAYEARAKGWEAYLRVEIQARCTLLRDRMGGRARATPSVTLPFGPAAHYE